MSGWRWQHKQLAEERASRWCVPLKRTSQAKSQGSERLAGSRAASNCWSYPRMCWHGLAFCSRRLLFAFPNPKDNCRQKNCKSRRCSSDGRKRGCEHYMTLTKKVCENARRRVLQDETLAHEDKLFSIYEPHTELIKRGKQPVPIQFGHNVLVVEDAVGFVVDYRVVAAGVLDQDLVVPVMKELQERFSRENQGSASFDRGLPSPVNQQELGTIVDASYRDERPGAGSSSAAGRNGGLREARQASSAWSR